MHYSSHIIFIASAIQAVCAYPSVGRGAVERRQNLPTGQTGAALSHSEGNTGIVHTKVFNAQEQYVNVAPGSKNQFVKPGPGDLRGECPGLNAAANHGFLPHNGIASAAQTIQGLGAAFGMGADLAGVLAAIAMALDGDPIAGTWSIGGPYKSAAAGLLGQPLGISNAHNKYEGDASVTRKDAYINNGNVGTMDISKFDMLYSMTDSFTIETLRQHNVAVQKLSVATNPYYFSAPFSGLVTPAAHEFICNLMSNHSAAQPEGYLNRDMLKTFFAVSGPDGAHVNNVGQEAFPQNWYRRPSSDPYCLECNLADTAITLMEYPSAVTFGGNMGKVNSYVGVEPADFTGGAYKGATLAQGNNLACFMFQSLLALSPDFLKNVPAAKASQTLLDSTLTPLISKFGCPSLEKFDTTAFSQFPGFQYQQPLQS